MCLAVALLAGCGGGSGSAPAGAAADPPVATTQEPTAAGPATTADVPAVVTSEATTDVTAAATGAATGASAVGSPLVDVRAADEPDDSVRTLSTGTPYALDPCERAVRLDRREHLLTSVWRADDHTQVRQVALLDSVGGGAAEYSWLLSGLRGCVEGPPEGLLEEDAEAYARTQPEWGIGLAEEQRVQAFAAIVPGADSTTDLHVVMRRGRVVTLSTVRALEVRPYGGVASEDGEMLLKDTLGPAITPLIQSTHPLLFELVGDDAPPPFGEADDEPSGEPSG